jgi:signal transduction histidine kinase
MADKKKMEGPARLGRAAVVGERRIGERRAAHEAERSRQMHQALEAAGIGIWDWDLGSNRVVMSDTMKSLLEAGAGSAAGSYKSFLRAIHREDRGHIAAALKTAIRRRGAFDEEFRRERSDRSIHWLRIRGRVLVSAAGVAERVMGSIHDKTDRKMAYDALESARSELEAKVKERTRELLDANEQLRREIAIKNRLQEQIMEISEKEQRRIGQDLHDSLSQQLGGIIFMGQVLFEKLEGRGLDEAQGMQKLLGHLQNALTHTRDLAKGLYPTLGENGLVAALRELALAVSELFAVAVTVDGDVETTDENVTIHVYRIVQEALNNAIRHGKATRIAIRIFRAKGAAVLTISDNGIGFPEKPNRKGMGLNIMEYRASAIGASFAVTSKRRRGTVVTCRFDRPGARGL